MIGDFESYYDGISPEVSARHERMPLEELEAEIEEERKKCEEMKEWQKPPIKRLVVFSYPKLEERGVSVDNFNCIYKILSTLEKALDCTEFELSQIDYDKLNISKFRWAKYIEMLADSGYIKNVRVYEDVTGETCIKDEGVRITIKGLEYLSENTIMQRIYKTAKGIREII